MLKMVPGKFTVTYDHVSTRLETPVILHGQRSDKVVRACWDTGAEMSCIDASVIGEIALTPRADLTASTANGRVDRKAYRVDVTFPGGKVANMLVSDANLGAQDSKMLIGMDLISHGEFAVGSTEGHTTFSFRFPSDSETDFVGDDPNALVVDEDRLIEANCFPRLVLEGCVIEFER